MLNQKKSGKKHKIAHQVYNEPIDSLKLEVKTICIIAEKVFEAVKSLSDLQAAEVLDFVEFLKAKTTQEQELRRKNAWATLEKYKGAFDGTAFNREELYDRP